MKKEVLIAIIIGFALGLVITFGVWTANRAIKENPSQEENLIEQETTELTPTPTPTQLSLLILSPEDNIVSSEEEISVEGKTLPGAIVVIIYNEGEKILEADENGNFETTVELAGGSNEIEISAYDEKDNETSQTLTVVFSTAEI